MGSVARREQCPVCLDSGMDNLVVYNDGGKKCFACSYTERSGLSLCSVNKPVHVGTPVLGVYTDLPARGISKSTCEFFGYQIGKYTGQIDGKFVTDCPVHIANYYTDAGELEYQKLRTKDKKFKIVNVTDTTIKSSGLYGKWKYEPSDKVFVTIVEGEVDALSIAEVCGTQYPVVSPANGAESLIKSVKDNYEYLLGFKHIVLAMDNDEAGRKNIEAVAEMFPPGVVRVVSWPLKDANEMLLAGRSKDMKNLLFSAKKYRPPAILSVSDLMEETLNIPTAGISYPWQYLTDMTYGIHPGIITICGGSGIGKSEVMTSINAHIAGTLKQPIGIFSFEYTLRQILQRIAGNIDGVPYHIPGDHWDRDRLMSTLDALNGYIELYNPAYGTSIENILPKIRYLNKALGIKYVTIDPITYTTMMGNDERRDIDRAMNSLISLVGELEITVFIMAHLSKPEGGKTYEQGRMVVPSALRGSQSLQFASSFIFGVERNKLHADDNVRRLTRIRCIKDRLTSQADGQVVNLLYNRDTCRLDESNDVIEDEEIVF